MESERVAVEPTPNENKKNKSFDTSGVAFVLLPRRLLKLQRLLRPRTLRTSVEDAAVGVVVRNARFFSVPMAVQHAVVLNVLLPVDTPSPVIRPAKPIRGLMPAVLRGRRLGHLTAYQTLVRQRP